MSVQSFSAICDDKTHTLILGSMPGVASLSAIEYYAHKRNAFWPILLAIIENTKPSFDTASKHSYAQRIATLTMGGYGLWDVLAQCEREGSLDSAIVSDSIITNDFVGLLQQFPRVQKIAFNGKTAQNVFKRHVQAELDLGVESWRDIVLVSLPSSSPAMASLSLEQKFEQWQRQLS